MEPDKLKQIVEAALLAADEPLTVDQLVKLFRPGEVDDETIRADLREVLKALESEAEGRGYELKRVASGYRYQVRQDLSIWISRLWEEKPPRYTRALLETLALVAYRQPVTRGDIEQVRGVSVSQSIMRTLLERGWIRVVGQREVPGRPAMYGTTKEFLDYFDLKSLDQLPPLAEIRELIEPLVLEEAAAEESESSAAADVASSAEISPLPLASVAEESAVDEAAPAVPADGPVVAATALDETNVLEPELDELEDAGDFEAEVDAALAAADAIAARISSRDAEHEAADADAERPAQVVDVVTGLGEEASATEQEQPTAEVVQLPTAPH